MYRANLLSDILFLPSLKLLKTHVYGGTTVDGSYFPGEVTNWRIELQDSDILRGLRIQYADASGNVGASWSVIGARLSFNISKSCSWRQDGSETRKGFVDCQGVDTPSYGYSGPDMRTSIDSFTLDPFTFYVGEFWSIASIQKTYTDMEGPSQTLPFAPRIMSMSVTFVDDFQRIKQLAAFHGQRGDTTLVYSSEPPTVPANVPPTGAPDLVLIASPFYRRCAGPFAPCSRRSRNPCCLPNQQCRRHATGPCNATSGSVTDTYLCV